MRFAGVTVCYALRDKGNKEIVKNNLFLSKINKMLPPPIRVRLQIVSGSAGLSDKCRFRSETFRPAIACESRFLGGTEKQAAERRDIGSETAGVRGFQFAGLGVSPACSDRVESRFGGPFHVVAAVADHHRFAGVDL